MKTNYFSGLKLSIYPILGFLAVTAVSCGSYQSSSTYDSDGIYGNSQDQRNQNTSNDNDSQSNGYKEYFGSLKNDDQTAIFTDVDNYNTAIDSTQNNIQPQQYTDGYSGWGNGADNVTVNVYSNPSWDMDIGTITGTDQDGILGMDQVGVSDGTHGMDQVSDLDGVITMVLITVDIMVDIIHIMEMVITETITLITVEEEGIHTQMVSADVLQIIIRMAPEVIPNIIIPDEILHFQELELTLTELEPTCQGHGLTLLERVQIPLLAQELISQVIRVV